MMATGKSCSRWLAPVMAITVALGLTGCFDKEPEQRKAFMEFLQNTAMRSGEHLPALSDAQKKEFGTYVSDYAILYGFSQQVTQAMDTGLQPVVDSVNSIRVPQDYIRQRDVLNQANGALNVLGQQVQNAKVQADSARANLKQPDDLKPVFEQAYQKLVVAPANAMAPLIPATQTLTQQLIQVGDFLQQQGALVGFNNNGVQFPTAVQVNQYNTLVSPLAAQHQAFMQAYSSAENTLQ